MPINELIAAIRAHAIANYEIEGWDILTECWSDEEIEAEMNGAETEETAIRAVRGALLELDAWRREQMADARYNAGY